MKLPIPSLTLPEQLAEFDQWITPSLQEIQDSSKYQYELTNVDVLISKLGKVTSDFSSVDSCSPEAIADACVNLIENIIAGEDSERKKLSSAKKILESLCSLLFMVTGKTDNNLKCQFPVFLAQTEARAAFPIRRAQSLNFQYESLGRTITYEKLSKVIADALCCYSSSEGLEYLEDEAKWLLGKYISAILKDKESVQQFWALGKSYFALKKDCPGSEKALLAPIVIFKVRGSVSASGGHIPENLLRNIMQNWGMERGIDFNLNDVVVEASGDVRIGKDKTRAYDFVLPYKTEGWQPHIFIQCQFYAGDSGSVSHKVVDQTQASRPLTLQTYPNARFIEYLDGAGYYSSLNKDLKHMLGMETTKDFIQVRSAHVKLRRELQNLGFLTPIDIEHAIIRSENGDFNKVVEALINEGYAENEIDRALFSAINRQIVIKKDENLYMTKGRESLAKSLFIVDLIAIFGRPIDNNDGDKGNALIPGYGGGFGAQIMMISKKLDEYAPNSVYSRNEFSECITWLIEEKLIIIR